LISNNGLAPDFGTKPGFFSGFAFARGFDWRDATVRTGRGQFIPNFGDAKRQLLQIL